MTTKVDSVPKGYHTATPSITVRDAAKAIEFYKKAFDAVQVESSCDHDGKIMHAEITIGDSKIMLNDEFPQMGCVGPQTLGGTVGSIYLYVENVDAVVEVAVKAGATLIMPATDMFWGDRYGQIQDPFGHRWGVSTRVKNLTKEEIDKGQQEWQKQMAGSCK